MRRPADHVATTLGGHASPATTNVDNDDMSSGAITASAEAGNVTCVTAARSTNAHSAGPGNNSSFGATTSVAPDSRPMHSSENEASKLGEANCNTRPPAPTPKCLLCAAARLETPTWLTTTPLGCPVEPEV